MATGLKDIGKWSLVVSAAMLMIMGACEDDEESPVAPPAPAPDKVVQLDGNGDFISIPLANHTFNQFTLEVALKVPTYDSNVHYISQYQNAYLVLGDYSSGQISTWANGLTPIDIGPATTTLSTDQWHHFAFSYDGTNQYALIDGVVVLSTPTTGTLTHNATTYNQALKIGARYSGDTQFVTGQLDEVRIWNIYRTPAEIQANMFSKISAQSGLVGYWNFDDGTANDVTAYGADGTLNGDAVIVNQ
ncbi:MAG TPA: LamG domain-containing protein [Candidatus Krumholzibacteria bacterium]|nr:LamG domain-containing protein [Candidatus Krumholzibacteria bacterium]